LKLLGNGFDILRVGNRLLCRCRLAASFCAAILRDESIM
jgi:hypothetical protein